MDIGRVRAVVSQMTLKEKTKFLGCGLSLNTPSVDRLHVFGLKMPEELLFYRPALAGLGCAFDRELAAAYGELCARAARADAEAADGAVNLGVIRDPMADGAEKMFSEDPYVTAELAKAFIEGAGAVIGTNILSGEGAFRDRYMDPRALNEIYHMPFRAAADKLSGAVIPSGCLNGEVAANAKTLVQRVAGLLKPNALIVNEAGSIPYKAEAVNTGASFEIGQNEQTRRAVERDIENGRIAERRVDACVERTVHYTAERYEALKKPLGGGSRFDFDERAAAQSAVLLKNERALPLTPKEKAVLLGDLTKEESAAFCAHFLPVVRSIKEASVAVVFARGNGTELSAGGVKALSDASDAGLKTVLVILSPRPVETGGLLNADAVLYVPQIYYATFPALAKILSGEVNPSGKLNVSWAFNRSDYPAHKNDRAAARGMYCYESVYNGYRYFNSFNAGLQFPFGHGLSYTEFEYSKLSVSADGDALNVEFVVKNVGAFGGDTVAFVFCDLADSPVYGLKSRLAAFARLSLDKGENTAVRLKIELDRLGVYSEEDDGFVTPGGKYDIKVAASAADIALSAPLKIPRPSRVSAGPDKRKIPSYYADRFSPLGTEIETVVRAPFVQKRNENALYLAAPTPAARKALEKAAGKRIKKALKIEVISDFTGVSEFGFRKILESDI